MMAVPAGLTCTVMSMNTCQVQLLGVVHVDVPRSRTNAGGAKEAGGAKLKVVMLTSVVGAGSTWRATAAYRQHWEGVCPTSAAVCLHVGEWAMQGEPC